MGNTPPTPTCLRSNGDHPYNVQLGPAAVYIGGREVKQRGHREITESWRMSYKVDFRTCMFHLTKTKGNIANGPHHYDEKLDIKIEDGFGDFSPTCASVTVEKPEAAGTLGLSLIRNFDYGCGTTYFPISTTSTPNARGSGITETSFSFYWREGGKWRVLMVCESKKRSKDEKPYMVTVSHYYAYAGNGSEFGLSVAVKRIRVSHDGHLDFGVDGSQKHPATALFSMFDQVYRNRTWPTSCLHCANSVIQRPQGMSSQSESEDSDEDYVPTALQLHGLRQDARCIIANAGVFKGNYNGNLVINIAA